MQKQKTPPLSDLVKDLKLDGLPFKAPCEQNPLLKDTYENILYELQAILQGLEAASDTQGFEELITKYRTLAAKVSPSVNPFRKKGFQLLTPPNNVDFFSPNIRSVVPPDDFKKSKKIETYLQNNGIEPTSENINALMKIYTTIEAIESGVNSMIRSKNELI